jgi:predicted transposase/invertase (TIGR01784 family)
MKKFAANDMGAAQFVARYGEVTASAAVQQAYREWIDDFRDMSIIQGARMEGHEQGIKQGREQGREQGIEETARNMLQKGWDIEMIMEGTGLTREHIESLQP